jgi:hypothetical protein
MRRGEYQRTSRVGSKWRSRGQIEKEEQGEIEEEEEEGSTWRINEGDTTTCTNHVRTRAQHPTAQRRGPNDDGTSPTKGNDNIDDHHEQHDPHNNAPRQRDHHNNGVVPRRVRPQQDRFEGGDTGSKAMVRVRSQRDGFEGGIRVPWR